jgi:anti-sigma factor RsiW
VPVPRVYVTRRGGPGTSIGCLGSAFVVVVGLAAVALFAVVGLAVLAVIVAGVLVTGVALVTQRAWRGARGTAPARAPGRRGVIDATATEVRTDRPTLPEDGPGPADGGHGDQ